MGEGLFLRFLLPVGGRYCFQERGYKTGATPLGAALLLRRHSHETSSPFHRHPCSEYLSKIKNCLFGHKVTKFKLTP